MEERTTRCGEKENYRGVWPRCTRDAVIEVTGERPRRQPTRPGRDRSPTEERPRPGWPRKRRTFSRFPASSVRLSRASPEPSPISTRPLVVRRRSVATGASKTATVSQSPSELSLRWPSDRSAMHSPSQSSVSSMGPSKGQGVGARQIADNPKRRSPLSTTTTGFSSIRGEGSVSEETSLCNEYRVLRAKGESVRERRQAIPRQGASQ